MEYYFTIFKFNIAIGNFLSLSLYMFYGILIII